MKLFKKVIIGILLLCAVTAFAACGGGGNGGGGGNSFKTKEEMFNSLTSYTIELEYSASGSTYTTEEKLGDGQYLYKLSVGGTSSAYYIKDSTEYTLLNIGGEKYYTSKSISKTAKEYAKSNGYLYSVCFNYSSNSGMNKTGTETILGKTCDIYTYSFSGVSWSYSVERGSGICLKFTAYSGDALAYKLEVTKLVFSADFSDINLSEYTSMD